MALSNEQLLVNFLRKSQQTNGEKFTITYDRLIQCLLDDGFDVAFELICDENERIYEGQ